MTLTRPEFKPQVAMDLAQRLDDEGRHGAGKIVRDLVGVAHWEMSKAEANACLVSAERSKFYLEKSETANRYRLETYARENETHLKCIIAFLVGIVATAIFIWLRSTT